MSEGALEYGTERVSDFGFRHKWYLRWVSEGALEYGTERVSDFGFGWK